MKLSTANKTFHVSIELLHFNLSSVLTHSLAPFHSLARHLFCARLLCSTVFTDFTLSGSLSSLTAFTRSLHVLNFSNFHPSGPGDDRHWEDPFLWIDHRGFHIIAHTYSMSP